MLSFTGLEYFNVLLGLLSGGWQHGDKRVICFYSAIRQMVLNSSEGVHVDTTEQIPSRVLTATDPHRPFWRREVVYAVVKQGDRYFVRLLSVTEGDVRAEKDPQPIDFRDVPLIPLRENGISTGDVRRAFSLLRQTDGNRAHLSTRVHAMLVLEGERIYAAVTGENSVGG